MYMIYSVRYGDTLDSIANNFNITVDEIKKINGMQLNQDVMMGDQIILPRNQKDYLQSYVVITGDTLYDIARRHNVDVNTLLLLNGLNQNDFLYPGQEIVIPVSNSKVYITKSGDTLDKILESNNISIEELMRRNKNIYLLEEQMIILND